VSESAESLIVLTLSVVFGVAIGILVGLYAG
jgi:hypothetical protein